jgi:hypothetical protein
MRLIDLGARALHRVIAVAMITSAVIVVLLAGRFYYSTEVERPRVGDSAINGTISDGAPKVEEVSFVVSPTMDTNPRFFFGAGDGSNGYYAERPRP